MKNVSIVLLSLMLTLGCSNNDFENTQLFLEFDKETYGLNDTFELTIKIYPIEAENTVRFHDDFHNIEISFTSKNTMQNGLDLIMKDRFIEKPNSLDEDNKSISQYTITKTKPFELKFSGSISEVEEKIIFTIPALKVNDRIDKSLLIQNSTILVAGNCRTVFGIEGKAFLTTEIKVKLD